jgi:hypothetical protein
MRKFLFEFGAALTVVILIVPVCFYAAGIAFYEAAKLFPEKIFELFETWYEEQ